MSRKISVTMFIEFIIIITYISIGVSRSSNNIKYISLVFAILIMLFFCIKDGVKIVLLKPYKRFLILILSITIFTMFKNIYYDTYYIEFLKEILFIFIPLLFAILITSFNSIKLERILNIIFYIYLISFIFIFATKFNLTNLKSINFLGSYSPFESKFCIDFSLLSIYFFNLKSMKKFYVSFLLMLLTLNRMIIIATIFYLLMKICKFDKLQYKILKTIAYITSGAIIFVSIFMYNDRLEQWIFNNLSISLDQLTSGRSDFLYWITSNNEFAAKGFGYSTNFLSSNGVMEAFNVVHGDFLKVYLELGIIFLFIFIGIFINISSKNKEIMCIVIYLIICMGFNHILDYIDHLTIIFLLIGWLYKYKNTSY